MEVGAEVTIYAFFEVDEPSAFAIENCLLNNGLDWHDVVDVIDVDEIELR